MRLLVVASVLALSACSATVEETRRQYIAESVQSTILLTTERETGGRRAGSGVVLGSDADDRVLIATTAHLLTPMTGQVIKATAPDGETMVTADILAVDEQRDLALLTANLTEVPAVSMQSMAQLGDSVWVVGFPWGERGTLVNGAVSQIMFEPGTGGVIIDGAVRMIDAPVNYGTSGGGVFDARTGRLVGIVRGYRTVKMSVPGTADGALTLPVAGETTVIPTAEIACFVARAGVAAAVTVPEVTSGCSAG